MQVTNIHQAKTHLSKLVERAAAGEEVIISRAGRPVAKLVPYAEEKFVRKPGGMTIEFLPGYDDADKEIEALFYAEPIEPPARHPRAAVVARGKRAAIKKSKAIHR